MFPDLLQPQILALDPRWLDRLARLAAALAKDGQAGLHAPSRMDAAAASWGEDDDDENDSPLANVEGNCWPEPVIVNRVCILPLYGVTGPAAPYWMGTSTERLAMQLLSAVDNPDVDEIVLRVNSPGGQAVGSRELADLVFRLKERKPITAWAVNGLMCSAAYFVASAATKVYATASSEVGSIGVMWAHMDVSGWEKELGVKVSVLSIPDDKRIGNMHEPLTGDAKDKLMSTFLQPYYDQFVGTVARNRRISADEVVQKFGGGLTMLAAEAVGAGMIDGVRDWNEYLSTLTGRQQSPAATGTRMEAVNAMKWTIKGKAVLFAADLIESPDADDAVCTAALRAWCAAKGVAVPADEDAVCKALKAKPAAAAVPVALPVTVAPPVDVAAEVARAMQAETARRNEITARAGLLGVDLADADVQAALANSQTTPAAFADAMLTKAQGVNRPVGRIEAGPASADKFTKLATAAVMLRAGPELARAAVASGASRDGAEKELAALSPADVHAVREIACMSFLDMAKESVRLAGNKPADNSDEAWATAFLKQCGSERRRFATGHSRIESPLLAVTPIHGPGSFPNLMGAIAQQTVAYAIAVAPITFYRWAERWDDSRDFNPQEIIQLSGKALPDEHIDTKAPGQRTFSETPAWIQIHEYSQGTKLSARMIVQGQMTAFMRMLVLLQLGMERNNNQLVYDLLKNNVTCPIDNVALFHAATHDNDITSSDSGPPSVTQSKAMRIKLASQSMPGDTEHGGFTYDVALYGTTHINDAEIQYLPQYQISPQTQAAVNQFNGRVEPIYEPYLSDADPVWYGISRDPRLAGIIYAYLSGSGPGGNRVTYFDDATQCQSFDFYSRFGTALVNYQKFVRNAGLAGS